jgi:hypothetical protein
MIIIKSSLKIDAMIIAKTAVAKLIKVFRET